MWRRQAILVCVFLGAVCSDVLGERVGFKFTGALEGSSMGTYMLFGMDVPQNSPISGSFSYDTTGMGIDVEPGARMFPQSIRGGYTLDINNGAIRVSASDYLINVADDLDRQLEAVDIMSVDYDSRFKPTPAPAPVLVNGVPWIESIASLKVDLSWLATTFLGDDEPKLTSDRPLTPGAAISGFVDGSDVHPPREFSIDSISAIPPLAGDYNRDGKLTTNDYSEWQRAFGKLGGEYLYADGNHNGVVDAADYVVFRNMASIGATGLAVPEPRIAVMAAAAVASFAAWSFTRGGALRRRAPRRRSWKHVAPSR
jgi:hypothetical protein